MKAKAIDTYQLELAKMLEHRSTQELDMFIVEHKDRFLKVFVLDYVDAPTETKQITLCKMCANNKLVSSKTRKWAKDWLKEHGYTDKITTTRFRYYGGIKK